MNTVIIAEAGVNHNGDINRAFELIDVAAAAGVDYVKFQTFKADNLVSPKAKKAEYQKNNIDDDDDSQVAMLRALELSHNDHLKLIAHCERSGVKFFSTAFDVDGIDYLDSLGLPLFKSPSGEITNYSYLKRMASKKKPIIISTGMATLGEIEDAIEVLSAEGMSRNDITVLHCNTEYPTPMEDVNLLAMQNIKCAFGVETGYSDHTLGIEVPIAAVALGASVIEKHFTLDRNLPGPDHKASLEPDELKAMVSAIRNIEKAMSGDGIKRPSPSEKKNKDIARKSIHSKRNIQKGQIIDEGDLIGLRPGNGITPMEWIRVVGKKANHDLEPYHQLDWKDFS